jgi:hypothetical protein
VDVHRAQKRTHIKQNQPPVSRANDRRSRTQINLFCAAFAIKLYALQVAHSGGYRLSRDEFLPRRTF